MRTATSWHANKIFWRIIYNYNLPFALWLGLGVFHALGISLGQECLVAHLFGFCFGCGLTHDLAAVVSIKAPSGIFVYFILAGFSFNLLYSFKVATLRAANDFYAYQDISE